MIEQEVINQIFNSIKVLNDHSAEMSVNLAVLGERVEWLVFFFKAFVVAFVGMVATQIWQLILLRKNNKK